MIVACEKCRTSFMADPAAFLPEGRTVRCASCGYKWFQSPPEQPRREPEHDFEPAAPPPVDTPPELEVLDETCAKAQARIDNRLTPAKAFSWAALIALIAGGAALLDMFREDVTRFWPQAANVYAFYGRDINVRGFAFEDVTHTVVAFDGAPVIEVRGRLRNIAGNPRTVPPLRAGLINEAGEETAAWTFEADLGLVDPGDAADFLGRGPAESDVASIELRFVRRGDTAPNQ